MTKPPGKSAKPAAPKGATRRRRASKATAIPADTAELLKLGTNWTRLIDRVSTTVDPNWTPAEALAASVKVLRSEPTRRTDDRSLPHWQWSTMRKLEECRAAFEGGSKRELIYALRICASGQVPMPKWLAEAYTAATDPVMNYRAKTWDDVFGPLHPKGSHPNRLARDLEIAPNLMMRALRMRAESPSAPIDDYFFEQLGQHFGIGRTKAKELYSSIGGPEIMARRK